jgi:hypothetical protein
MLKRFTARERQFAKMSEYIAISPAISIMHQCDLFWIQLLWLPQFEATQGRRGDCW